MFNPVDGIETSGRAFKGWNQGVKTQIRSGLGRPRLRTRKLRTGSETASAIGSDSGTNRSTPVGDATSTTNPAEKSSKPQEEPRKQAVNGTKEAECAIEKPDPMNAATSSDSSSDEEGEIRSAFSGDDGGVVINLEGGGANLGGVNSESSRGIQEMTAPRPPKRQKVSATSPQSGLQSSRNSSRGDAASDGADQSHSDSDEEGEINEDDDMSISDNYSPPSAAQEDSGRSDSYSPPALPPPLPNGDRDHPVEVVDDEDSAIHNDPLIAYASGRPVVREAASAHDKTSGSKLNNASDTNFTEGTLTLADISITDLQLQLRYYHIGRAPSEIRLDTLVRCPTCLGSGHLTSDCSQKICSKCGADSQHSSNSCPAVASTTIPTSASDSAKQCSLCSCTGHSVESCELRWRTSAWPPKRPLPPLTVQQFCYECGGAGHLGNDCGKRRPDKGLGTSSWSAGTITGGLVPACSDEGADAEEGASGPAGAGVGAGMGKRRREKNLKRLRDERERGERHGSDNDHSGNDEEDYDPATAFPAGGSGGKPLPLPLPKPSRSGTINIGGSVGQARADLNDNGTIDHQKTTHASKEQPNKGNWANPNNPHKNSNKKKDKTKEPGVGSKGGGSSKKKKKGSSGGGAQAYRPMPSSAKRAYIQGRR